MIISDLTPSPPPYFEPYSPSDRKRVEMGDFCPATFARNILWNWTRNGEVAIVPCPQGATGLARWSCLPNQKSPFFPNWSSGQPDLSDCKSNKMSTLESQVREEVDDEEEIVSRLVKLTHSSKNFYGGDLEAATSIMRTMANRIQYSLQRMPLSVKDREDSIERIFQGIMRSASHLLSWSRRSSWMDLVEGQRMKVATNLLLSLEENAFLLADVLANQGEQGEILVEASKEIGN